MENFRSTKNFIENTCASVADVAGKKCLTGKGRLEAARNCHRERLEKDIHFNYFWTRYAKLISVTLFAVHCAGCTNYVIADRYPDTKKTWIGAANPNFKEDSL
ncbi:hypothetical protein FXO37_22836 [Capsicum annuum]|nr:hypothetical protein FXO37_22836 [Capsicum annuum]